MSCSSKWGSTEIKKDLDDNLSIGWDYDTNPEKRFPMILFTPHMRNTKVHYHIRFSITEARTLHNWLSQFLKDHDDKKKQKPKKPRKRRV